LLGTFAQGLGGKGFNQAVACNKAGTEAKLISAMGNDLYAKSFINRLQELSLPHAIESTDAATGAAAISVDDDGRNSIIVALGANEKLSSSFIHSQSGLFQNAGVLLMQLETNLAAIETAITIAKNANPNICCILNPAPALPELPNAILSRLDFLTPNESELEIITGKKIQSLNDIPTMTQNIPYAKNWLVTLGDKGSCLITADKKVTWIQTPKVTATDTAGAGDAFNGAFAAGLIRFQFDFVKAARFASHAAAISVTRKGTSASTATFDEIKQQYLAVCL
jgi:ribokinase